MQPIIPAAFLVLAGTALSMSAAGVALLAIGLLAAKNDIAEARGIDKIVALTHLCFAIPLAVFGAEHLSIPQSMLSLVPSYMPWRMFWVYFVGFALIAASLSIATKRQVRWSGLLFGAMMFLFVAMLHLPGAVDRRRPDPMDDRLPGNVVRRRRLGFGGNCDGRGSRGQGKVLITVGRVPIAIAAIFFGVQHFLHPLGLPGVPLAKQMPSWVPARAFIDYVTGAFLIVAGVCFLLARKTRMAATYLGAWIVLLVVVIYGPVLIGALADPSTVCRSRGSTISPTRFCLAAAILSLAGARLGL